MTGPNVVAQLSPHVGAGNVADVVFYRHVLEHGFTEVRSSGWLDTPACLHELVSLWAVGDPTWMAHTGHAGVFPVNTGDGQAIVSVYAECGGAVVEVASKSPKVADRVFASFAARVPAWPDVESDALRVRFWSKHPMGGASSFRRELDVAPWDEIRGNYPSSLLGNLERLLEGPQFDTGGKLMLFHGPPGTGKSRFIQAMLAAWSSWCTADVVIDPDEFFNDSSYMNEVLLSNPGDEKWRLLVVEDGDEFMDLNAKERSGQALSRLLNIADGLIGQGLRVATLITTNVPMAQLNPAMMRSGRCVANLEFPAFPAGEAGAWLAAHGQEADVDGETVLADLYDRVRRSERLAAALESMSGD